MTFCTVALILLAILPSCRKPVPVGPGVEKPRQPEIDSVIANLELMPLRMNQSKGDTIGDRQRSLAKQLHSAHLLKSRDLPE